MKLTWVKEDYGFKASVLIVIDLDVPQGLHQLVQDPGGHTSNFQLRAVHGDDEVIPWGDEKSRFGHLLQLCRHGLTQKPPRPLLVFPQVFPLPTHSRFPVCSFMLRLMEKQAMDVILWSLIIYFAHVGAVTPYTKPAPSSALIYPLLYLASVCKWCCIFIFGAFFFKQYSPSHSCVNMLLSRAVFSFSQE